MINVLILKIGRALPLPTTTLSMSINGLVLFKLDLMTHYIVIVVKSLGEITLNL